MHTIFLNFKISLALGVKELKTYISFVNISMANIQTSLSIIFLVACVSILPALFGADEDICGTPLIPTFNSLSHGGTAVLRGQFPWIVSFYEALILGKEQFLCSGTLISSKF